MKKNNNIRRFTVITIMAFACIAAMLSIRCKDNCVGQPPVLQQAFVRFINASPDSPPVDMVVDSTAIVSGLAFNSFPANTTGYHATPATIGGTLSARFTGTTTAVLSVPVSFAPGERYTVVLLNKKTALQFLVLHDTLTAPSPDSSRIRFIHAVADLSSIDVQLGGKYIARGLIFGNSSGYVTVHSYLPGIDTGSFDVNEGNPPHATVFDLPSGKFALVGQSVFTMIALGDFDPNGTEPLPTVVILYDDVKGDIISDPSFGAVRLLNVLHPTFNCDLQIYNAVSADNLPPDWRKDFPDQGYVLNIGNDSASSYLLFGASTPPFKQDQNGNYWMGVRVSSTADGSVITDSTAINPFQNNGRYTVAVAGMGSPPYSIIILRDTLPDPPLNMATVRFFNASPDQAATSTLIAQGGDTLFRSIGFTQVTGSIFVPIGNTTLALKSSNGASTTLTANLGAEEAYTIVATGLPQDSSYSLHIYEK
ncbi:MAG TPA: DUF4397 domain-containing protein [Candidatus Kapabacteria bacterium]|nr:DUF4397 domain-containing protein [Candidatus Kapabacteria bacterium]